MQQLQYNNNQPSKGYKVTLYSDSLRATALYAIYINGPNLGCPRGQCEYVHYTLVFDSFDHKLFHGQAISTRNPPSYKLMTYTPKDNKLLYLSYEIYGRDVLALIDTITIFITFHANTGYNLLQ